MKYLFIIIMLLASFMAGSMPLKQDPVNSNVLESFNRQFRNAEDVSWTVSREFYKVHFTLNCQHLYAFYAKDGSLIATTRNMLFTQLPVILQTRMQEVNKGYWITELFELSNDKGTTYYITVENANNKIILRSVKMGWELYQKIIKA